MKNSLLIQHEYCRVCGDKLLPVLDLGEQPLNAFRLPGEPVSKTVRLLMMECVGCHLWQLHDTAPRDDLFRTYYYRSSINEQMRHDLNEAMDFSLREANLHPDDTVLSIGGNDGYELEGVPRMFKTINIDPARNVVSSGREYRSPSEVFPDYFPHTSAPVRPCKLIVCFACMYSVDDLANFLDGVRAWLAPDGVFIVQVSDLMATLKHRYVMDIVHEHVAYFTLATLDFALRMHGMEIFKFSENAVNGGSIRVYARHATGLPRWIASDPPNPQLVADFIKDTQELPRLLQDELLHLRHEGRSVLGLGASTKGNQLLAYCNITPDLLPAIGDRDPRKHGRLAVNDIPIISEEAMRREQPDVLLCLIQQFMASLQEREHAFFRRGGMMLVPLPRPTYIEGD